LGTCTDRRHPYYHKIYCHIRVEGKRDKARYLPLHVLAQRLIAAYLKEAGHAEELKGPLFRPVKNNRLVCAFSTSHGRPQRLI
jgi:hypothetical protein